MFDTVCLLLTSLIFHLKLSQYQSRQHGHQYALLDIHNGIYKLNAKVGNHIWFVAFLNSFWMQIVVVPYKCLINDAKCVDIQI